MSIRAQLGALALLIAGPLAGLLAFQVHDQHRADAARAAEGVQRVARAAALDTRRTLDETERVLRRLAEHAPVRAMSASQCDPAIEDFRASLSGYANIVTIDSRGELVCSATQGRSVNRSLGNVDWVRRALAANGTMVSQPTTSVVTGVAVVYVSYPVNGGLIAASLQLSDFDPVSAEHGFAEDTVISIVDADGNMVARSIDARTWVGKNVRGQGVVDIALAQKSGYVVRPGLMGVERVFGFAPVPGVPWVVYAGVRSDAVFADARASAWRSGGLTLMVLLATGALVFLVARRIIVPVHGIARAAAEVAAGRLEVRAPVAGPGELAEVAAQFNRMLDQRLQTERLLQQVIDTVPAIIHVKDVEGRYRLVNREFEKVTGFAARSALGRTDGELFAPAVAATITQHDQQALEGAGILVVEESVAGEKGTRHYIAGKASLRDAQGRPQLLCTAAVDISARKALEARQKELSQRIFEVSDEERSRLSRELHDRVGQPLAALRIQLDLLREQLPAESAPALDAQAALISELIRVVRNLTSELRPQELEGIGLAGALRVFGEVAASRYGFAVDVIGGEFRPRLPRSTERALFRVAQEAVANAAKHAQAETVTIELEEEGAEARVCIADDGRGIEADRTDRGVGLHAMRERVEEVGGRLEIESAPNLGTRVIAAVPRPG